MRRHLASVLAIAIGTAAAPPPAAAQQPQPVVEEDARRVAARALAEKGYSLFEAGKYTEALSHFRLAEAQYHAPTLLVLIARTEEKLGKLVAARDLYQRVVAEPLAADAPPEFRQADAEARAALASLKKRIPTLEVVLDGAPRKDVTLEVDGSAASIEELARGKELNPGPHEVALRVPGSPRAARTATLREGRSQVRFTVPEASAAPPSEPPAPDPPKAASQRAFPALAVMAYGVGGLGLGVGIVTGLVSIGKVNELDDRCVAKQCLAGDEELGDSAKVFGTVSTVGFVLAGIGAAAGTALLLLGPDLGLSRAASRPWAVRVSATAMRVEGTF